MICRVHTPSNEMGKLLASCKPIHFCMARNDGRCNIHDCILANAKEVAILPAKHVVLVLLRKIQEFHLR